MARRQPSAKIIAWSFFPTVIILTAVALVGFFAYQQVAEDLTMESSRELARLSAGQLSAELATYGATLDAVARAAEIAGGNPAAQRSGLQRASNRLSIFDAGVVILDSHGIVVASLPERPEIAAARLVDPQLLPPDGALAGPASSLRF